LSIRVQALAFLAESRFHYVSEFTILLDGFNAAITAIVVATLDVVLVVTVAIAFPLVFKTAGWLGVGIHTLAFRAVILFHYAS